MRFRSILLLCMVFCSQAAPAAEKGAEKRYRVDYTIELVAGNPQARVRVRVDDGTLLRRINFNLKQRGYGDFRADGELTLENRRAIWQVPEGGGEISFTAPIDHARANGAFDARMTSHWAMFRGDNMVPAAKIVRAKGAVARTTLRFKLPPGWNSDAGWRKSPDGSYPIESKERRFARPIGWMIVGELGIRLDRIDGTEIAVAAPDDSDFRRMDILTFVNFIWPELRHAFAKSPGKVLIVGANNPMWRGGLSAPNSFYLHADRPIVSENGTSALIHEFVHLLTRIRGKPNDDWIAEGIAEYYAIEILRRAGGLADKRHRQIREELKKWSKDVSRLRVKSAKGPITAKAVVFFQDLDREIRAATDDKSDLDDVVRRLMKIRKASLDDLRQAAEAVAGGPLQSFSSAWLQ